MKRQRMKFNNILKLKYFLRKKNFLRKKLNKKFYIKNILYKKSRIKYFKYKILLTSLIKQGSLLRSFKIFFNVLKGLKLNFLIKKKFKTFLIILNCLAIINLQMKNKIYYHSGKKYILPIETNNVSIISKSFRILKQYCIERFEVSIILKLIFEIMDVLKSQGNTYNYIYKDWRVIITENRKLLNFFKKFTRKKLKRKKKKKKKWKIKYKKLLKDRKHFNKFKKSKKIIIF